MRRNSYTKVSPFHKRHSGGERGGGNKEALIRGADSRNRHEDPLASRRFPNRARPSGGVRLVCARHVPQRIAPGQGSRDCSGPGAAQRGIDVGPDCQSCTLRCKLGGRRSDPSLRQVAAELAERRSRQKLKFREHLRGYYGMDQFLETDHSLKERRPTWVGITQCCVEIEKGALFEQAPNTASGLFVEERRFRVGVPTQQRREFRHQAQVQRKATARCRGFLNLPNALLNRISSSDQLSRAKGSFQRLLRLPEGQFRRLGDRIQDLVWESGEGLEERPELGGSERVLAFEDAVIDLHEPWRLHQRNAREDVKPL
jgi:hypothetical protein